MMKDLTVLNRKARGAAERVFGPLSLREPRQASLYQEMNLGAAVGVAACLILACVAGAPGWVALSVVPVGFCAGSVFGLLLWNSSGEFPEDPVLPPARGQERHPQPAMTRAISPAARSVARAARR